MASGTPPTYQLRGWFIPGSWEETAATFASWAMVVSGNYSWEELGSGLVPNDDVLGCAFSRELSTFAQRLSIGQGQIELDNSRGQYTSGANQISINDIVSLKGIYPTSVYGVFRGRVESTEANPDLAQRTMLVSLSDAARDLMRPVRTGFMEGTISSSVYQHICNLSGFTDATLVVDPANRDPIPFAYFEEVPGGEGVWQIQQPNLTNVFTDRFGRLRIVDRNYDVSSVVAGSYNAFYSFAVIEDQASIINRSDITIQPRQRSLDVGTIGFLQQPLFIAAQATKEFSIQYLDPSNLDGNTPCTNVQTPVPGLDYFFNTSPDGRGTDITSAVGFVLDIGALYTKVTATNSGSDNGYFSAFQLRGNWFGRVPQITVTQINSLSRDAYSEVPYALTTEFIASQFTADALAAWQISRYRQPEPTIEFGLNDEFPDVLDRDMLDLVWLINSETNVSSGFRIASVTHELDFSAGLQHSVTYRGVQEYRKTYFILDSSADGRLNVNRLGY